MKPPVTLARKAREGSVTPDGPRVPVSMTVNGGVWKLTVEPRTTLLDALRDGLGLSGTKKACDRGECGACTVHVDGRRILSCMTLAAMQDGKHITTIEGLAAFRVRHRAGLLDAPTAKDWGVVNEIVPADRLLARAHEIADGIAALPPLTSRYTRIALTQKLRRIIDEGSGYSLALEGISAADVALAAQNKRARSA